MKVILIEDEAIAMRKLRNTLIAIDKTIEIIAELVSVYDAQKWFSNNDTSSIDIVFSDIQLSDGLSFEIFEQINFSLPIIFTTAYNEYAIRAFKLNGIDYLLKPIIEKDIINALQKFKNTRLMYNQNQLNEIHQLIRSFQNFSALPKPTFLTYYKDKIAPVQSEAIAWFHTQNQLVYAVLHNQHVYQIPDTLEEIEKRLSPDEFFRANRQYIIARKAILEAEIYFNKRLIVRMNPATKESVIISREKVARFRLWLQGIVDK